jgi:thiol:disulfide interchange protein DsbD
MKDPSAWTYKVKPVGKGEYDLLFNLKLQPNWHIYAMNPGADSSLIPPSFDFAKGKYELVGKTIEQSGKLTAATIEGVEGEVRYYKGNVVYRQRVKASHGSNIKGEHIYQLCNESICLPPKTKPFTFHIP